MTLHAFECSFLRVVNRGREAYFEHRKEDANNRMLTSKAADLGVLGSIFGKMGAT